MADAVARATNAESILGGRIVEFILNNGTDNIVDITGFGDATFMISDVRQKITHTNADGTKINAVLARFGTLTGVIDEIELLTEALNQDDLSFEGAATGYAYIELVTEKGGANHTGKTLKMSVDGIGDLMGCDINDNKMTIELENSKAGDTACFSISDNAA